jgi:hypothetical protein
VATCKAAWGPKPLKNEQRRHHPCRMHGLPDNYAPLPGQHHGLGGNSPAVRLVLQSRWMKPLARRPPPGVATMSRLDRNIKRLIAKRYCLDLAREAVRDLSGVIFEFGLGYGRTYDHLRSIFPARDIFVFERDITLAHPACIPDDRHLFLGDLREILPRLSERFFQSVSLLHIDLGSKYPEMDQQLISELFPLVEPMMKVDSVVIADLALPDSRWERIPLPAELETGSTYFYRVTK